MDGGGEGVGETAHPPLPLNIDTLILKPKKQLFCWDERDTGRRWWRGDMTTTITTNPTHHFCFYDYILDDLDNVAARRPKTT